MAMKQIRTFFINGGILTISVLLSVIALEFAVRWLFPAYDPSSMVKFYFNQDGVLLGRENSEFHHRMKSGDFNVTVRFNQYGLRDRKDLNDSTASDWFVVGDSFSYGHGVEEPQRYSNLLEARLGRPVYNISIPTDFNGYEKLIQYAIERGATIKRLIVGICMENDLQNYASRNQNGEITVSPSPSQKPSTAAPYYDNVRRNAFFRLKIFLGRRSALYNVMISTFHQNPLLNNIAVRYGIIDEYEDGISRIMYSDEILRKSCEKLLALRQKYAISEMVLLLIPSRALWLGGNQEIEAKMHVQFASLLREHGFEVVDLRPVFEASGNPMQYHFQHDGHWNVAGHQKAAEELLKHLNMQRETSLQ
ncbi:hypothetical protein U14_00529 [Candidatus Moduliflexus flocculans]|uniref:AlgX/AlgJ SGNH hydrolase-like domain-containing protein n=1 Tax=Candidatus Moduliflexus flocculans TaxID=1499966 RepID=A0A0S6VUI2_9BACT|nr:hypothetical protein U14_00529 [Candidatus Moduliflexus flocculans]